MQVPCMIDILGLERYLQAAHTHAEVHGIHVNEHFSCVAVLVHWHKDVDFLPSSLSNVSHESWKSRMWIGEVF